MRGRSRDAATRGSCGTGRAARPWHRGVARVLVGCTVLALGALGGLDAAFAAGVSGEGPYPWKYPASGNIAVGTGTTVSKTACTPSTPQFPSPYAPPCLPQFKGNNGGATSNGITATTITLAQREFPQTANTEQVAAQAKNGARRCPRSPIRSNKSS